MCIGGFEFDTNKNTLLSFFFTFSTKVGIQTTANILCVYITVSETVGNTAGNIHAFTVGQ